MFTHFSQHKELYDKTKYYNLTIDLWYWGVARYVWTSISDFCSNGLDLKHSVRIVKEYLQEASKLANNEMMIYNGQSTVAVD